MASLCAREHLVSGRKCPTENFQHLSIHFQKIAKRIRIVASDLFMLFFSTGRHCSQSCEFCVPIDQVTSSVDGQSIGLKRWGTLFPFPFLHLNLPPPLSFLPLSPLPTFSIPLSHPTPHFHLFPSLPLEASSIGPCKSS